MLTVFNRETNEGKTYTQKGEIDVLFAGKAEEFNSWFNANYFELEQYFKNRNRYDGAIFSDTYLNVYENILYRGGEISNYKGLFLTAYFRNMLNSMERQNRFLELAPYHEKSENDSEYYKEIDEANTRLERKIFEYVYSFYSLQEYEIFKMYINLQPAISYRSLSKIIGQKYWYIQRIISNILLDIRTKKEKIKSGEIYHMNNDRPIKQLDQSYLFSRDYETLWSLRMRTNYSVICIVNENGSKCVANMTPNGEIFAGETCYSDFEGVSKSEFIKQCEELSVEFIKPNYPEAVQTNLFEL